MLSKKEKLSILERILSSETFSGSRVYQALLKFLVESSISGKIPKEYTLAIEVLHKSANFDPGKDTSVRVYIYNLRKKLNSYYKREGKNEAVQLEIPKGHYEIIFKQVKKAKRGFFDSHTVWIACAAVFIVLNLLFFFWYSNHNPISRTRHLFRTDTVWGSFFDSKNPKQVVLGDHFFYVKDHNEFDKRTIMRRDDVNNLQDFERFRSLDAEGGNYTPLKYPMFPRNSVWPFSDVVRMLVLAGQPFSLNYASNVTAPDLLENDMVFVGSFHTLGTLDQTLRNSNFRYTVYPNSLTWFDNENDTLYTYVDKSDPVYYHVDYGIVRKIPGPGKNTIFIFTSFHETGTIGIIQYFTDPDSLKELEKYIHEELGYVPEYFEMLFKATGYNRTTYKTEFEHVFAIDENGELW